jgi:hypothetical protein
VSDSFHDVLQEHVPALAGLVNILQLVATPDKQAPEKCAVPMTLFFKLLVEAVLQPAYAFLILAAIAVSWRTAGLSCGLRALCDAKRAASDRLSGKMQAKRLKVRWKGEGILVKGTWAKVVVKPAAGSKPSALRTVALTDCDPTQVRGQCRWLPGYAMSVGSSCEQLYHRSIIYHRSISLRAL